MASGSQRLALEAFLFLSLIVWAFPFQVTMQRVNPFGDRASRCALRVPLHRYFSNENSEMLGDDYCELFEMGYPRPRDDSLPGPEPDLSAEDVVERCMDSLLNNDDPRGNAGLEVCFNFSSDRCRAALGGSLEEFVSYASNPTFGSMINAKSWTKVSTSPLIDGTSTRGAMQTVLVDVEPRSGRGRRFLWTMQQERRPPKQGCWLVHECIFVDNAYALTL